MQTLSELIDLTWLSEESIQMSTFTTFSFSYYVQKVIISVLSAFSWTKFPCSENLWD